MAIPMFMGQFFTGLYVNFTRCFLHAEVQGGGRTPEVVIIWWRKTILAWSQQLRQCFGHARPLPPASTPYDTIKHHYVQTGSTNNLKMETNIDAISMITVMFLGIPSPTALESTSFDFRKHRQLQTSCFGYCFYFRFVPDAVLRSRILSTPAEVDPAWPKTLQQSPRSHWYRFLSQSYNYFRYPSTIYTVSQKKLCKLIFCQNFAKFRRIVKIFGKKIIERTGFSEVYSFSTSPSLCQHTTVWTKHVQNCYITL